MPEISYRHYEEWVLEIRPSPGEEWPRITYQVPAVLSDAVPPAAWGRQEYEFQPLAIHFSARRDAPGRAVTSVVGVKIRKDGTPGKNRGAVGGKAVPQWARDLIMAARREHGLTSEFLREQNAIGA